MSELFLPWRIVRRKTFPQVVERQIYVVQRISNLVRNRRCQPSDDGRFFRLMQLILKRARALQLRGHIVEEFSQLSNLIVTSTYRDPIRKVAARHAPRGN